VKQVKRSTTDEISALMSASDLAQFTRREHDVPDHQAANGRAAAEVVR